MKKIGLYFGICALGIALGCSSPDEGKNEETKKDNPTDITIENVYVYHYAAGKPTCLYSPEGCNIGSNDMPREGAIALEFDIKVCDEDIIKNFYLGWGKYEGGDRETPFFSYEKKPKHKETVISRLDNGHDENYLKNVPFKIKVVDWKGDITEKEFTLGQILKDAKPMKTKPMKSIDGRLECDDEY